MTRVLARYAPRRPHKAPKPYPHNFIVGYIEARIAVWQYHMARVLDMLKAKKDRRLPDGIDSFGLLDQVLEIGIEGAVGAKSSLEAIMDYQGSHEVNGVSVATYGPVLAVIEIWHGQLEDGDSYMRIYRPFVEKPRRYYLSHLRRGGATTLETLLSKCAKIHDAEPEICQTWLYLED